MFLWELSRTFYDLTAKELCHRTLIWPPDMEFRNNPCILCRLIIACGRMEEQIRDSRRSTRLQTGLQDIKRIKMLSFVLYVFSKTTGMGPNGTGCGPCRWEKTSYWYKEIQILSMWMGLHWQRKESTDVNIRLVKEKEIISVVYN
jgi:hypothetical protein